MNNVTINVAKESSVQNILDKISEGSGLFANPIKSTINTSVIYEQGIVGNTNKSIAVNCDGEIYVICDQSTELKKYKPTTSGFVVVDKLPFVVNVQESCCVVFNNEIHLLGGSESNIRSHYKWDGVKWKVASSLPYDFCGGKAVVFNGELHIIGGGTASCANYQEESFINNHYKWDGETWVKASDLPYVSFGCTPFVVQHKLHLIGGGVINETDNSTKHFIWDGFAWSDTSDMPVGRLNASAIKISDTDVYIAGGKNSRTDEYIDMVHVFNGSDFIEKPIIQTDGLNDSGHCLTYDNDRNPIIVGRRVFTFNGNVWKSAFSFGTFNNGTAIVYEDNIHVFYGANHYSLCNKDGGEWKKYEENNMYNIVGATSVVMDDGIHLLGSISSAYADYHCLWNGTEWKLLSNLPDKLINGSAVKYDNRIHIIGGTTMNEDPYNHYMLLNNKWVAIGRTPYDVIGTRAVVVINNEMYAVGKDDENTKYLMKFDGVGWSVVTSWAGGEVDTIPIVVSYLNRLHVSEIDVDAGRVTQKMFTINNKGIISGKYFEWNEYLLNEQGIIPSILIAMGKIMIISTSTGTCGNCNLISHMPKDNKTIEVWIPKNHQFICDKGNFLPIIGSMEDSENGYTALTTRKYTIGYIDDESYTIS